MNAGNWEQGTAAHVKYVKAVLSYSQKQRTSGEAYLIKTHVNTGKRENLHMSHMSELSFILCGASD